MVYDALEAVRHRNTFYRDSYRKLVLAILILLLIAAGLVGAIIGLVTIQPTPTYFAATDTGRIIPLVPLNKPNLPDKAVLQWASEAAVSVYSYNYVDFRKVFQDNKRYFTAEGWKSFTQALSLSANLDMVKAKKYIVSAVLAAAPVITNQYLLHGRYTWKVQMPLLVTFENATERNDQRFLISLTIRRISTLDDIYGIGITQFIAEPA
jgi:intracellular multiplication protein IcmL